MLLKSTPRCPFTELTLGSISLHPSVSCSPSLSLFISLSCRFCKRRRLRTIIKSRHLSFFFSFHISIFSYTALLLWLSLLFSLYFSLLSNFHLLLRLCPLGNRILEEILRQSDSFTQSSKRTMLLQCYQMCCLERSVQGRS